MGELASATALTVRALHHYDKLGLLEPGERTAAGHRLYVPADVRRLYGIIVLRELGLRLDEIGAVRDRRPPRSALSLGGSPTVLRKNAGRCRWRARAVRKARRCSSLLRAGRMLRTASVRPAPPNVLVGGAWGMLEPC